MRQLAAFGLALTIAACAPAPASHGEQAETTHAAAHGSASVPHTDSAFAEMQERGRIAMGVNQYTSAHEFAPLPDGGRIALWRLSDDSAGTAAIRAHMRDIAGRFAAGDFTIPGFVHEGEIDGARVMTERRSAIRYTVEDLDRGGALRLTTNDAEAVAAIHRFLEFQRHAHRAH